MVEVSAGAVLRFLRETGYEVEPFRTRRLRRRPTRFERDHRNNPLQTDSFTLMLQRGRRRVHQVMTICSNVLRLTGKAMHHGWFDHCYLRTGRRRSSTLIRLGRDGLERRGLETQTLQYCARRT